MTYTPELRLMECRACGEPALAHTMFTLTEPEEYRTMDEQYLKTERMQLLLPSQIRLCSPDCVLNFIDDNIDIYNALSDSQKEAGV
jgi:hypothetical protein